MTVSSWTVCSLVAAVLALTTELASAATLFPYGTEHGDSLAAAQETTSVSPPFTFLGESFSTIRINSSGILYLGPDSSTNDEKYIAPFHGDVADSGTGSVFYRSTSNTTLVQQVTDVITSSFTGASAPTFSSLFITTWHQIPKGQPASEHNTFQCVLAYNSSVSYVLFLYQEGGMQWMTGSGSSQPALVGMKNGESKQLILPVSRTNRVLDVASSNNTGVAGRWLFRVDGAQVQLPAPLVGLESVPAVLESVGTQQVCAYRLSPSTTLSTLSLSLLVDGAPGQTITFSAGSSRACTSVTIVDDRTVEENEKMIVELVYSGSTSLSFLGSTTYISITDDDVMVGWKTGSLTVSEDEGSIELCAVMLSSVTLFSQVVASLERTERGVNSNDYTLSTTELTFDLTSSSEKCVDINIRDDDTVENDETLILSLNVENSLVFVTPATISITILDNGDTIIVEFENTDVNINEASLLLQLPVLISGTTERPFNLSLNLQDGTAKAGVHYRDLSGVYPVPSGISKHTLFVPIINDNIYNVEGTIFTGFLSSSDPAVRVHEDSTSIPIHIIDDDASKILINFTQSLFTASENDPSMEVCIWIYSGQLGPDSQIAVNFTSRTKGVVRGQSEAFVGEDFELSERIVHFNSSHTAMGDVECMSIPINDDDVLEDKETFIMEIKKLDNSPGFRVLPFTVACNILDNDFVYATLETTELTVPETRGTRAELCLLIDDERSIELEFRATPVAINATPGVDFSSTPQTFKFPPSSNRVCIQINILNDFKLEDLHEAFYVDFTATNHVVFNESRAVITITDTDKLLYSILAANDVSNVMETEYCSYNSSGRLCIFTTGRLDVSVSFTFHTMDGTAIAGEDYEAKNETVVVQPSDIFSGPGFTSGQWATCINFCTKDDNIVEGDEYFYVVVDPSSDQISPKSSSADRLKVTIHDNDILRMFPTRTAITVDEGDGVVEICANMIGLSERPVELVLNPESITAINGEDYEIVNRSIYFPSYLTIYGHLSAAQVAEFAVNPPITTGCVNITIVDDNVLESTVSKVFKVSFTSSSLDPSRILFENNVTITIEDDDEVTMSLSQSTTDVIEGLPRVRLQLTLVGSADFPISATIATRTTTGPNTATPGVDYDVVSGTTVVLPPGYATGDPLGTELSVNIRDDTVLEANETFEVVLSTGTQGVVLGTTNVQTIFIIDNDRVEVSLEATEFRVLEGDRHSLVCISLRGATETTVIINTNSTPGTAGTSDYVAIPTPAQFEFSNSSQSQLQTSCVFYQIVDDDILEAVESFYVTISTTAPRVDITSSEALVSIVDNDGVYMSLVSDHVVVDEASAAGSSGASVNMCVQMTGIIQTDVRISLSTLDATAQGDLDYIVANHSIIFSPKNELNQTKCATFTYSDDEVVEEDEHFYIELTSHSDIDGIISILTNRARITITDDDEVSIRFEHSSYSVVEGEDKELEVCVDIGAPVEKEIVVQFSTVADSAQHYHDFLENGSQLIFTPRGPTRECTPIIIMDDAVLEDDEQFEVLIIFSDPALYVPGHPTHTNTSAVVKISDDDHVTIWLESSLYEVGEDVGQLSVCTLLNGTTAKEVPVTFSSQPGSALDVSLNPDRGDFVAPQRVLRFPASSEHQQRLCVEVSVLDDERIEDIESFYLEIAANVPRIRTSRSSSTVRIQDNDVLTVSMNDVALSAEEGDEVELCVERNGILETTISIDLPLEPGTAQAGADYLDEDVQIQFSPSYVQQRNECVIFRVLQDDVVELTEFFSVKLSSSAPRVRFDQNVTKIEIYDSDNTTVQFQTASYSVEEHDVKLSICVVLGAAIEKNASVRLVTGSITAMDNIDYTHVDVELTFRSRGLTTLCTDISIVDDRVVEDSEEFFVFLTSRDSSSLVLPGGVEMTTTTVTITDNDNVTVSLVEGEMSVQEDDEEVEVCVRLQGVIDKDVTVHITTVPGTALAGVDYITATRTLLFTPSPFAEDTNCAKFTIVNDTLVEATESFFIQLATTGDRQVIPKLARAEITVVDNDVAYVDFTQLSQTVSEADGSVSVCVELESRVEIPLSIQLATRSESAQHARDFNNTYVVLDYEPLGDLRQCTTIPINDDDVLEDEEQFLVYIFDSERVKVRENAGGRGYVEIFVPGLGSGDEGEVRILSGGVRSVVVIEDNDRVTIGMVETQFTVPENQSVVIVCLKMEGETEKRVNVLMKTEPGTAIVGNDFFSESKAVSFSPRSESREECVRIQLIDRPTAEDDEHFFVQLSSTMSSSIVRLHPTRTSILILDDDVVCEEERTSSARGDYIWATSRPGEVELPCQNNEGEVATRTCSRQGNWEIPYLDNCLGDVEVIIEELEYLPFSCLSFHQLLLAITQATEEKAFEEEYISVVARFFSDFAAITARDGYVVSNMTCRQQLDTFTVGVNILDLLFSWPRDVVWTNSTSILFDFEAISGHLVSRSESAEKEVLFSSIAFSSSRDEMADVEKDGVTREFFGSSRKGPLDVSEETDKADSGEVVLGSIHLPPSLFLSLTDKESSEVGVWFSLHRTAHLFPLEDLTSENSSVSTPVISATVGGHHVQDLEEPIRFSLRLLNQSVTDTKCASWDYEGEEWVTAGCTTESVRDGYITCTCTHLTNFAGIGGSLLPTVSPLRPRPTLAMSILSLVGVMLGLLGVILTIFVLIAFGKLRRRRTTILRAQLCFSLLFLMIAYVGHIIVDHTGSLPQDIVPACAAISTFTHYFTLTSLIWLGGESLLLFRKLVLGHRLGDLSNIYFVTVSTTSWLVPILFAAIPAVLNSDWIITENQYCFISSLPVFLVTFAIPAIVALTFNLIIYLIVIGVYIRFKCKKQPPQTDATAAKKKKMKKSRREATVRLIFSSPAIGVLFVLAWIFASLTMITGEASIALYLFSGIFTATLGWFLFIYYIVTAKDTRKLVHEALCGKPRKDLNVNQFISMESLGQASGIDESDSDSDYPERERRYGEFDVTYVGRKAALIEQKFSIRWGDGEGGEGARDSGVREGRRRSSGGGDGTPRSQSQSVGGQILFSAFTPSTTSSSDQKPGAGAAAVDEEKKVGSPRELETVLEDQEVKSGEVSPTDESPTVQIGSHDEGSQEDVNSDDGSPQASTATKNFLAPGGQIVFTMSPST